MLQVERIDSANKLLSIEKLWNKILEKYAHRDVFLTHEWITNWWQHFGKRKELYILLIKDNSRVIGIAPLMLAKERLGIFPVRKLSFLINGHSVRSDFILPEKPREVLQALVGYWADISERWDVLDLRGVPEEPHHIETIMELSDWSNSFMKRTPWLHSYLPLEKDWKTYLQSRSRKFRKTLQNNHNRLKRAGKSIKCKCFYEPEEVAFGMSKFCEVDLKSWKRKKGEVIIQGESTKSYYLSLARIFSEKGWCEVRVLEIDDRPVAGILSLMYRDKVYTLKTSYDMEFSAVSPGMAVFRSLIEDSYSRGIKEMDFVGKKKFTELWSPYTRRYNGILIFNNRQWYARFLGYLARTALVLKRAFSPSKKRRLKN